MVSLPLGGLILLDFIIIAQLDWSRRVAMAMERGGDSVLARKLPMMLMRTMMMMNALYQTIS